MHKVLQRLKNINNCNDQNFCPGKDAEVGQGSFLSSDSWLPILIIWRNLNKRTIISQTRYHAFGLPFFYFSDSNNACFDYTKVLRHFYQQ